MGQIKVKVDAVRSNEQKITNASSTASSVKNDVRTIYGQVDAQIRARNNIGIRLQNVANLIENSESRMYNINGTVLRGVSYYQNTDRRIMQMKNQLISINSKQGYYSNALVTPSSETGGKQKIDNKEEKKKQNKKKTQKDDPLWKKILLNEYGDEVAFKGKVIGDEESGNYAKGDVLGASYKISSDSGFGIKRDEDGKIDKSSIDAHFKRKVEGEAHLAQGEISGHLGLLSGKVSGKVGAVSATGSVGASIFENGNFAPKLQAKVEGSASAAHGEAEVNIGNEELKGFVKAEGDLATANAGADVGVGKITYKDENGIDRTTWGANANVSAEAYLATGSVKGGFSIFGFDIDISVEGKAGGAGVEAGAKITTDEIRGKIGAGLGLGVGLEIGISRSN